MRRQILTKNIKHINENIRGRALGVSWKKGKLFGCNLFENTFCNLPENNFFNLLDKTFCNLSENTFWRRTWCTPQFIWATVWSGLCKLPGEQMVPKILLCHILLSFCIHLDSQKGFVQPKLWQTDFWGLGQVYRYWRQTTSSCEILCIDTEAQLHKRWPSKTQSYFYSTELLPFRCTQGKVQKKENNK